MSMNIAFKEGLAIVLRYEGGYVNNPADKGCATNKGITQAVYDAYRKGRGQLLQSVKVISDFEVENIYLSSYWSPVCESLSFYDKNLSIVHFDSSVNCGTKQAGKFLQRALGVNVDGIVGNGTLAAVKSTKFYNILCKKYLEFRLMFYTTIVANNPTQKIFLKGWSNRIKDLKTTLRIEG
jgi:lysozyme family protein